MSESENLVWRSKIERSRSFEQLQRSALDTLHLYAGWRREQDRPNEQAIRNRVNLAPPVGACAAEVFERLTDAGMPEAEATTVAAETAASVMVRRQAGVPEQADAVFDAVGALADQVATGRDKTTAVADFREAIVGWRGDGDAGGKFSSPHLVTFDDGTVMPDGVEVAGIRETGARHSIVTPQVEAGINTYLTARGEGKEIDAALEVVAGAPDVRGTVSEFAETVELYGVDIDTARAQAVAATVADAALGQFQSLRNAGMDIDQAVATAAGGNPVAVHAIGGYIARVRDGFPEDFAEPDAWSAAVDAATRGEDYRGDIPDSLDLPGFSFSGNFAQRAIERHTPGTAPEDRPGIDVEAVRRYEWLTRHGMDPASATHLATVDTAAYRASRQAREEADAVDAAEDVIREVVRDLDLTQDAAERGFGDNLVEPDVPDPVVDEAEQLTLDHNHMVAESAIELFEKVRRYGRSEAEAREDVLATFHSDDTAVADAALGHYRAYRDAEFDQHTAAGLAAEVTADEATPHHTGDESTVDTNELTNPLQGSENQVEFWAEVGQRYQSLVADGVEPAEAADRAWLDTCHERGIDPAATVSTAEPDDSTLDDRDTVEPGPLTTVAMHSLSARFLRAGDRFEWNGEVYTADDAAVEHEGVVTVPLELSDGSNDWVEIPATAMVPLHHDEVPLAHALGVAEASDPTSTVSRGLVDESGRDDVDTDEEEIAWNPVVGEPEVDSSVAAMLPTSPLPEREPEAGSWIARNLPASDDADDGGLAQHQAELREEREYIAALATELDLDQARDIARRAEELGHHLAGCNLDVGQCSTCSIQEQDSSGNFWTYDVPAARARLAAADISHETGDGSTVDTDEVTNSVQDTENPAEFWVEVGQRYQSLVADGGDPAEAADSTLDADAPSWEDTAGVAHREAAAEAITRYTAFRDAGVDDMAAREQAAADGLGRDAINRYVSMTSNGLSRATARDEAVFDAARQVILEEQAAASPPTAGTEWRETVGFAQIEADHDAGLAERDAAEHVTAHDAEDESTADITAPALSAQAEAAATRRRNNEELYHSQVWQRYQALMRDGVDMVTALRRAEDEAAQNWQVEPWSAVIPRTMRAATGRAGRGQSAAGTDTGDFWAEVNRRYQSLISDGGDPTEAADRAWLDTCHERGIDPAATVSTTQPDDSTLDEEEVEIEEITWRPAVGELEVDTSLADLPPTSSLPERAPEPHSWIARNLPTQSRPTDAESPDELRAEGDGTADVLDRIDQVLAEEDAEPPPFADRIAECEQAVEAVESAVQHIDSADTGDEDAERAERCARWNAEDAAAERADDVTEGWGQ